MVPIENCGNENQKSVITCDAVHILTKEIQENLSGSNTDGSLITAVSNSFLSP